MDNQENLQKSTLHKFFDINKQIGIIFLYFILNIFLQLLFLKDIESNNFWLANSAYLAIDMIVLVIFIFMFRKIIIPDFKDYQKNWKKYLKENYQYWIYGLIVMFIANIILGLFIGMATNEEGNQELIEQLPIYAITNVVIIAPIIEELLTRSILKDTFKNPYVYYILSSLIFGSLHLLVAEKLIEVLYIIPYGALGYAFAVIYKKSNNIWTNITMHSIHNLIAVISIFLIGG